MKTILACLAAATALTLAAGAHATTYLGTENIDGATINLSFTTDGKLGALTQSDLTAYDISMVDGSLSAHLNNSNSYIDWIANDLTATSRAISYNFTSGINEIYFRSSNSDDFTSFTLNFYGQYFQIFKPFGSGYIPGAGGSVPESGEVVIATVPVSGVPEPSIWAMMLAGVGVVGVMLRRGRRMGGLASPSVV